MILIDSSNTNQTLAFIPQIRKDYSNWHIVTLRFDAKNEFEAKEILEKFITLYEDNNGFCYLESNNKATSIIKLREIEQYSDIQKNIENNIGGKTCKVLAKKMSASGLKKIQINLYSGESENNNELFIIRETRKKNVILIAEDDMFVRNVLSSFLKDVAEIYEVETGDSVLEKYKEVNPDIVLLDIHLPNKSGLDLIKPINTIDSSAFIIISSSDSVKENVLNAMSNGAVGFLVKPIQKEKLFLYLQQCVTFNQIEEQNYEREKKNIGC